MSWRRYELPLADEQIDLNRSRFRDVLCQSVVLKSRDVRVEIKLLVDWLARATPLGTLGTVEPVQSHFPS